MSSWAKVQRYFNDAEIQEAIGAASNDFSDTFFYKNDSNLSLDDLKLYLCSLLPSVKYQTNKDYKPYALCGYEQNRAKKPVERAIHTRYINIKAIPYGYNHDQQLGGGKWNKGYEILPQFMPFDVDENDKPQFRKLYPDYRCHDIHDALDIPRPLAITINPISWNCQFLYVMRWTEEEYWNPKETLKRYKVIRRSLCILLGADPGCGGDVIRSPFYIAGHHRIDPSKRPSTRKIDILKESAWHFSKWYSPHEYTLDELENLVEYLKDLHCRFLGNEQVLPDLQFEHANTKPVVKKGKRVKKEDTTSTTSRISKESALAIDPTHVMEGDRNASLFNYCRHIAYKATYKFKPTKDHTAFFNYMLPIALNFSSKMPVPEDDDNVVNTIKSIINFCLSDSFHGGLTTEAAKELASRRWAGHVKKERRSVKGRPKKYETDDERKEAHRIQAI